MMRKPWTEYVGNDEILKKWKKKHLYLSSGKVVISMAHNGEIKIGKATATADNNV